MANQPHDNVRMLEMMQESDVPTIGMCMGDIGTPSRILGPKFGAPFTYATFHHERTLAPGQLSFQQMIEIYRYDAINPDTDGLRRDRRPDRPQPQPAGPQRGVRRGRASTRSTCRSACRSTRSASSCDDMPRLGLTGLSVTIPHKEAIAKFLTKVDPAVKGIGAVNTVLFDDDEVLGYNTDYNAAMDSLESAFGAIGANAQPAQGQARARARRRRRRPGRSCTASNAAARSRRSPAAPARRAQHLADAVQRPRPSTGRPATTRKSTSSSTARRSACTPTSTKRRSASRTSSRR